MEGFKVRVLALNIECWFEERSTERMTSFGKMAAKRGIILAEDATSDVLTNDNSDISDSDFEHSDSSSDED